MNGGYVYLDGEFADNIITNYFSLEHGTKGTFSFNSAYDIISSLVSTGKPLYIMSHPANSEYLIPAVTSVESGGGKKYISVVMLIGSTVKLVVENDKPNEYSITA